MASATQALGPVVIQTRPMGSRNPILLAVACLTLAFAGVSAAQDHGQYSQADIDAGARVYSRQCATCHGPNGDLVPGIDLRNQQFKRGMSDEELGRTIVNGIPGTGMPPNPLQPGELTGVIAFIRAGFDPSARSVRVGSSARGKSLVEGKGGMPDVSSDQWDRSPHGSGSLRHRSRTDSRCAQSIGDRSHGRPDADQQTGKDHDEGRPHDHGPPPERGHLHRAGDRRQGTAALAREERDAQPTSSRRSRRCRRMRGS